MTDKLLTKFIVMLTCIYVNRQLRKINLQGDNYTMKATFKMTGLTLSTSFKEAKVTRDREEHIISSTEPVEVGNFRFDVGSTESEIEMTKEEFEAVHNAGFKNATAAREFFAKMYSDFDKYGERIASTIGEFTSFRLKQKADLHEIEMSKMKGDKHE